ncbi:hypothetical protein [Natronococcus sp. JC468]|uniref:hypothetical protein n=1 Tax=Natronococcus sp. JC468 TaxID=1961921 RepID=UPI001ADEFDDE|nr:hypothetical protein [Natronococcus sp. JC468]
MALSGYLVSLFLNIKLNRTLDGDEAGLDDDREMAVAIEQEACSVKEATCLSQLENRCIGDVLESDLRSGRLSLESVLCISKRRFQFF